jgi:hypothetical protein
MSEQYVVLPVRERDGNSVPADFNSKSQAASFGRASRANGRVVRADEAAIWDHSHEHFEVERIYHQTAYGLDGACADMAEDAFSRLRRAEAGIFRDVARADLIRCTQEPPGRAPAKRSPALKPDVSMIEGYPRGVRRRFTACRRGLRATR